MKTIWILLAGAFLAAGCATGYHSYSLSGGYSETWYAPDTVRVVFRGNEYTFPEQTQDFALLRAAELAIAHGYSYFRLNDGRTLVFFEPRTGLVVQFFKEKPANIFTYDAAFLRQSVRQKYGIK
jgi:hypothetical protein